MLHCWKSGKQKLVYDTASGAIVSLTSLEYKMIQAITPPLSPLCPSSLRYELAKYDSADVEEAYEHIYALSHTGILFAEDIGKCFLRVGDPFGLTDNEQAREVASLLGGKKPEFLYSENTPAAQVEAILTCFN